MLWSRVGQDPPSEVSSLSSHEIQANIIPRGHLYRSHMRPKQCPRCWEVMEDERSFTKHIQVATPCDIREEWLPEGLDQQQKKKLGAGKGKRKSPDQTAEDEWREIYTVLFPGERYIHSPCKSVNHTVCQYGDLSKQTMISTQFSLETSRRHQLPTRSRNTMNSSNKRSHKE